MVTKKLKIFLSKKNKLGWIFGMFAASIFSYIAIEKNSYLYLALEISAFITFLFGFFVWNISKKNRDKISFILGFVVIFFVIYSLFIGMSSPNFLLESLMVLNFSLGGVFLVKQSKFGWIFYGIGHVVFIWYGIELELYFISILQAISLIFAYQGFRKFMEK